MIDLAFDKEFAKLVEEVCHSSTHCYICWLQFYNAKKPVSAVCHGPAALVLAKRSDGKSIVDGIAVTGFSNAEEAQTPYNDFEKILPFSLEDKLNQLGGKYETGGDWQPKVCWEGGVLTGKFHVLW
jgi:putative intracellular protease/amidase